MTPGITASFETWSAAEAARQRLIASGIDPGGIDLTEQGQEDRRGLFDKIAEHLAPGRVPGPGACLLTAEISTDQLDAAMRAIDPSAATQELAASGSSARPLEGRTFEFIETAEELAIEKQLVVREEIVLTSHAHEHVEEVIDTVRRTEVEIEPIDPDQVDHSGRKR